MKEKNTVSILVSRLGFIIALTFCLGSLSAPASQTQTTYSTRQPRPRLEIVLAQYIINRVETLNKASKIENERDPLWLEAQSLLQSSSLQSIGWALLDKKLNAPLETARAKQFVGLLATVDEKISAESREELQRATDQIQYQRRTQGIPYSPTPKRLPWLICKIFGC